MKKHNTSNIKYHLDIIIFNLLYVPTRYSTWMYIVTTDISTSLTASMNDIITHILWVIYALHIMYSMVKAGIKSLSKPEGPVSKAKKITKHFYQSDKAQNYFQ